MKIRASDHAFVLYEANSTRPPSDDPEDNLKGHRAVGHYSTIEALLNGVRQRILKSKSKKARDLEDFLKVVVSSQQEIRTEIKKIAFLASKKQPKVPDGTVG